MQAGRHMKKLASIMMVIAALSLAGCGGGGSGPLSGSQSGGGSGSGAAKLSLLASVPQLPSDGSKTVTLTALVEDSSNNVVSGAPVTFQASSGALQVSSGTTGSNGTATATLSTGGDPTNRTIKVTATSGSTSSTVDISVVGTKLSLSGPTSLVLNHSGTYTATLVDSSGNGIANQTVTVTSAKDNTLNPATLTTNSTGQATFQVTAVNSGTDTLTAAALGLQATQSVSVSSNSFAFTSPTASASVVVGASATVTVVWTNSGSPVTGQTVNFSATRGTLSASTATTDSSGSATVTISSTTSGPAVISASSSANGGVSAQVTINFIATNPSTIDVQSSPTTVATQGQSILTATVRDASGNLVANQTVDFALTQDPTSGALSSASAVTNAQGQASVDYTAGSTTSGTNGVTVTATVQGTSVSGTTSLTVAGQTVFLSLGTGNLITAYSSTQYEMPYTVQAVDSAGNPVSGVTITFSVQSMGYIKGERKWDGTTWATYTNTSATDSEVYVLDGIDGCQTEDANNDGIEDNNYNNDVNTIWPGLVASTDVSSATTDSSGTATVNLIYPKDHAYYVAEKLTASATVQGTQSSTSATFWLPGLATDFNTQTTAPPGPVSPYGTATSCASPN